MQWSYAANATSSQSGLFSSPFAGFLRSGAVLRTLPSSHISSHASEVSEMQSSSCWVLLTWACWQRAPSLLIRLQIFQHKHCAPRTSFQHQEPLSGREQVTWKLPAVLHFQRQRASRQPLFVSPSHCLVFIFRCWSIFIYIYFLRWQIICYAIINMTYPLKALTRTPWQMTADLLSIPFPNASARCKSTAQQTACPKCHFGAYTLQPQILLTWYM